MPRPGRLMNAMPGPAAAERTLGPKTTRAPLPVPPPAGQFPPEDSRLWLFVPKAVQQGEAFIQEDTRDWFRERGGKVQIARVYMDHPRWLPLSKQTLRAQMHNAHIVSEIHILARLAAGLPEMPSWVAARMTVKQQQADLNYRLVKTARDVYLLKGKDAMMTFADRAPGQFLKWLSGTWVPKKVETETTVTPGQLIDPETADQLLEALGEELKRRQDEASLQAKTHVLDFEDLDTDAAATLMAQAEAFDRAKGLGHPAEARKPGSLILTHRLQDVVDLEADVPDERPAPEPVEWD